MLDSVMAIAEQTPPVDNKLSRFGNPAFKTFHDRVEKVSEVHASGLTQASYQLHRNNLEIEEEAIPEVSAYFQESWGNAERVDYGSGMELNFLCWM